MSPRLILLVLLGALTLLRWAWGALRDLTPQESYLALCGFTPALAYFDGPPGTALSVAWGLQLAGPGGLGAAFFWPIFAALATLALYGLVAPIAGRAAALSLAVLLNLLPIFNEAALTPGSAMPVSMFALAFLACVWRGLAKSSVMWWLAAGLCAAGGLAFAYQAWILLPSVALVLLASHRWRPTLLEPGFWLALVPPLVVLAGLVVWNDQHGWVHFIGGTWQTAVTLHWTLLPTGLQAAAGGLSPLVLAALLVALIVVARDIRVAPKIKFLGLPAGLATLAAFYATMQGVPATTAGLLAAALALPLLAWLPLARLGPRPARWVLGVVFLTAAIWTASSLASHRPQPPLINTPVAARIDELRQAHAPAAERPLFLIASDAPLASALTVYLPDTSFAEMGHPPVYVLESAHADSQFALWPRYDQFVDAPAPDPLEDPDPFTEQDGANPFVWRSALYITRQTPDDLPQAITAAFAAYRLLAEITTPSGETLRVYLCEEYETLPL